MWFKSPSTLCSNKRVTILWRCKTVTHQAVDEVVEQCKMFVIDVRLRSETNTRQRLGPYPQRTGAAWSLRCHFDPVCVPGCKWAGESDLWLPLTRLLSAEGTGIAPEWREPERWLVLLGVSKLRPHRPSAHLVIHDLPISFHQGLCIEGSFSIQHFIHADTQGPPVALRSILALPIFHSLEDLGGNIVRSSHSHRGLDLAVEHNKRH